MESYSTSNIIPKPWYRTAKYFPNESNTTKSGATNLKDKQRFLKIVRIRDYFVSLSYSRYQQCLHFEKIKLIITPLYIP